MNDLISVIVPIYKVEPYLRKCLDSIINQTYRNLEIILVDDGSPDNCGAICDEYAGRDPRIKVLHKHNGGLSDARNAGMDIMMGDYVAFVDSDDWIEPNMYTSLMGLLRHFSADMAFGGVADDLEEKGLVITTKISYYGEAPFVEGSVDAMRRYFHGSWAAWDKLYRAELFEGIRFPVGEINEDEAIVLQLLDRCKRVCYTDKIFYHYMKRMTGQSITTARFSRKKLAWVKHCAANLMFVQEKHPELELDAAARYRGSLLWSLTEIALSDDDYQEEIRQLLTELKGNRVLFRRAPFAFRQDRIRMYCLLHFPFEFYRTLIRKKRGVK